jgi:hypothetical protein
MLSGRTTGAPGEARLGDLTRFTFVVLSAISWALVALYFATAHGRIDFEREPVGRDFVNAWTAGRLVAAGRAVEVFDPAKFLAAGRATFHPALTFHFWSYPPTALFTVAPLGWLDYFPAFIAWNVVGLALLFAAARNLVPGAGRVALLVTSPAVAMNLASGQNGFLTAALLFAGFAAMDRRPGLAGVWFGLLTFKPQLGFLVPLVAVAQRKWRLIAVAAAVALLLCCLSVAAFGLQSWRAFLDRTVPMQGQMMVHGKGPFQWLSPSPFMSGRVLGFSPLATFAMQAPFTLLGAWFAWRAYRRQENDPLVRFAIFALATFIASPQSFNYDLIPLSLAAVVLAGRLRSPIDQVTALLVWFAPFLVILLNVLHLPIVPAILSVAIWRLDRNVRAIECHADRPETAIPAS